MTSMAEITGRELPLAEVHAALAEEVGARFEKLKQ
jgi:hypothetical protein